MRPARCAGLLAYCASEPGAMQIPCEPSRFLASTPAYIARPDGPSQTRNLRQGKRSSPKTAARGSITISKTSSKAGLALQGTEVKALRAGEASIAESYAEVKDGQVVADQCQHPPNTATATG